MQENSVRGIEQGGSEKENTLHRKARTQSLMSMIFQAAEVVKSAVFITILQAAHGYEGKFFFSGWRARKKRIYVFLLNLGKSVEAKKIFDGLQPEAMRCGS